MGASDCSRFTPFKVPEQELLPDQPLPPVELPREWRAVSAGYPPRACSAARPDGSNPAAARRRDRKSTRLNSSHQIISYAVFCLKKKKKNKLVPYVLCRSC